MPPDKNVDDKTLEAKILVIVTQYLEDNHYLRRNLAYEDAERLKTIMRDSTVTLIQNHANECLLNRSNKHSIFTQRLRDYLQIITTLMTILAAVGGWIYIQKRTMENPSIISTPVSKTP